MTIHVTVPPVRPRQGRYDIDGEKNVRVSTVVGMVAKPELDAWKERVGFEEARRIARESADRGTAVHKLCEDIDNGCVTYVAPELRPFVEAYLAWKQEHVARLEMIEETVYHKRLGYAGTLDRLVRLKDGRLMIADLKTGKRLDWVLRLQQSAYEMALESMGVAVDGRMFLHLPWNGGGGLTAVELDDDAGDRAGWKACLTLYRLRLRRSREERRNGT
jgi:hypothetical protein